MKTAFILSSVSKHMLSTLLIATLLVSTKAAGQETSAPFDVHSTVWGGQFAPQSPEALAISRYGDQLSSLYSGSNSYSILVYQWIDNLFSLPISLEYSSNGFRPGIACSPEGLGWALNAGGVITREVRGIPDETWHQGYSATDVLYSNPSGRDNPVSDYIFANAFYRSVPDPYEGYALRGFANWYNSDSPSYASSTQKYIYTGGLLNEFVCGSVLGSDSSILVENEPDIYHFSFPGHSGSFILQPDHVIRFINSSTPSGELSAIFNFTPTQEGRGSSFTITDGQGVKYVFADTETTNSFDVLHGNDEGGEAVSCWRLSSIVHPSGKAVSFTYTEKQVSNICPVVTADHMTISDGTSANLGHTVYQQWIEDPDYYDTSLIYNTVYEKHLTGINFAGRGSATFVWNAAGKLTSIGVYNAAGRLLKNCTLSYYIPKNTSGTRHASLAFLASVSLSGEGVYYFSYDSADDNHLFPYDSASLSTDLWYTDAYGYYSSVSLRNLYNYNYLSLPALAAHIDSLRVPDLTRTRMGMLSSVTYPAGGRSMFTYELNDWSRKNDGNQVPVQASTVTGGLRVCRIDTYDENGTLLNCRRYQYTGTDGLSSGVLLQYPQLYFKYHFTSNTPGVDLKIEREAVSTTSSIGFTKDSHIEYLRVVETVSKTVSGPALATTVHTFGSAANIIDSSTETEYLHQCATDQTEFNMTNDGTILTEWQNHGMSFFSGKPASVSNEKIALTDPATVTYYAYNTYDDPEGSSFSGKTIYFGHLFERVYNTRSPYLASIAVADTAANGTTSHVTTSITVDSLGRISETSSPDSHGDAISTSYSYHSVLPGLITQKTVTRAGRAVSATKYDYTCLDGTSSWYVPSAVSSRLVSGTSFGSWRTERSFASWNAWGNPESVTDAAGRTTSWTWGYNGLHPTACSQTDGSGATLGQSWTWIPMVGPTTFTEPSGRTTSYYYDAQGRLTEIRDHEGTTVVAYDYYMPGTGDTRIYSDRTYVATTIYCNGGAGTDVVYYDGLGRTLQAVGKQASGNYNTDIIKPFSYEVLGRESVEQYPYARSSNGGTLRTSWPEEQSGFYEDGGWATGDDYLYGVEHSYENRTGGRPLTTVLPGYDNYVEYGTGFSYGFNTSGQLTGYAAGTCSCITTIDGDGNVSVVWTDREGRTVREDRTPTSGVVLSTLYTYDDRGNLVSVTQPKGTSFSYSYDALGRQVMKTVPGSDAELYIYDSAGRVVMSQDGRLRAQNRWILSTWDAFDCIVRRQIVSTDLSQSALQAYFPVTGSGSLPSSAYTLVGTIEEYGYLRSIGATVTVPSNLAFAADATASSADLGSSLNLKIYEKVLQLPTAGASSTAYGASSFVERAFYHDALGRELQTVEKHVLGGIVRTSVERDCQGNPLSSTETVTVYANGINPIVKHTEFTYDSRGRITTEAVSMGGSNVTTTSFGHDALGRPYSVSGNGLQQTQSYTFQGWTAGIQALAGSSNIFNEALRYADSQYATPLHTGAITEIQWQQGSSTPSTYAFSYDGAGRLTGTLRYVGGYLDNAWTERDIVYDANGNVTAIKRYGPLANTPVDNLSITYTGNTLSAVGAYSFSYDSAGCLIYDPLRQLTFTYNILSLPSCIETDSDEVDYVYLADGTKALALGESNEDGYAYLGSMVFALNDGDWLFDSTPFSGGRIRKSASSWAPERYVTDHLGSIRAIVRGGQVVERNDYYPYGGRHDNSALAEDPANRWRFSGKERLTTAGVNLIDFGARLYDDRLCRWTSQDPLSEKYYGVSPYAYCAGDPVGYYDLGGGVIIAKDYASKRNIINSLPKQDAQCISFDRDGVLNNTSIQNHSSESIAFHALKALSSSATEYHISSSLFYKTRDGIVRFKSGESYDKGVTLIPGAAIDPSPDENVYVVTCSYLNENEQAMNFAHEAYGHAYFYELQQQGEDVNPFHHYVPTYLGSVWDDDAGFFVAVNGRKDNNERLSVQINTVVKEVEYNLKPISLPLRQVNNE